MEPKKNDRVDFRRWYGTFFNLGLMLSVGVVLVAFEWKAKDDKPLVDLSPGDAEWKTEVIPITIQTPPAPPPPVGQSEITVIDNDIKIENILEVDINLPGDKVIPVVELEDPPIVEVAEEIWDFTEVRAEFQGGMDAWYKYLRNNLAYPKLAQRTGVQGTVLVRFVINTDGSIQDVEVVRPVDPALDKAAADVILNSPPWKAARHQGKAVRFRMTMPIKFKLN
ncbi:hypothetical protein GCM10009119_25010 [Algoriphagus jejuensis]|uniref:TonB C-terminal domain-containing protein n=1 Tax=Algoriphagus jejuensis TaxID=419934 RepID=A0ABN1N1T9_9BACT